MGFWGFFFNDFDVLVLKKYIFYYIFNWKISYTQHQTHNIADLTCYLFWKTTIIITETIKEMRRTL